MDFMFYDGLPSCAISCANRTISLTPCGPNNVTSSCLCPEVEWQHAFGGCVMKECLPFDGLRRRFGFGLDFWTLRYDTIVEFMKIFYAFANVYTLAIAALKATILFFYQRVFGGFSSPFTTILWCTQTFNLLTFIGFTIPTIAQCQPLSFAWEGWDGRHEGFCLNILSMIVTHAAVNIGLDIWMLILPSTQVLRLNLRWREKAEILAMFGIGIFYATAATPLDPKIISSHKTGGTQEYGPSTARRFNEDAKEYTNYGSQRGSGEPNECGRVRGIKSSWR
ncbi:hypothetical protein CGMCC3_g16124 [Colletotrichum fructicola]|nr:uncharacterized protein CGMCC3_g16124 [Colletotrichum fructicola]KAE9567684.1 hypothetical protein CGMCC3_g16124 [Colletotrichum fructicola]